MKAADVLHYLPIIVRSAGISAKDRKFVASIIHQNRNGKFVPSEKQSFVICRIVREFQ